MRALYVLYTQSVCRDDQRNICTCIISRDCNRGLFTQRVSERCMKCKYSALDHRENAVRNVFIKTDLVQIHRDKKCKIDDDATIRHGGAKRGSQILRIEPFLPSIPKIWNERRTSKRASGGDGLMNSVFNSFHLQELDREIKERERHFRDRFSINANASKSSRAVQTWRLFRCCCCHFSYTKVKTEKSKTFEGGGS